MSQGVSRAVLLALIAAFLAWHLPLMFRTAPGLDEDFYGVPGIAIHRHGVPQIPYIPSRNPHTIYYHADEILYTLPPLHFYIQSAFHAIFGDSIGVARLGSLLAGLMAVLIVDDLARVWFSARSAGAFAAGLFLFSRAFSFPATMARPDMTAIAFGLVAIWWVSRPDAIMARALGAGICAGLSLLAHPLGMVPACQVGLWLLIRPDSTGKRIGAVAVFTLSALAALALWLPLIALHPDWFRIQFFGNVLGRAGPGLARSLLNPFAVFGFQCVHVVEAFGPVQAVLYLAGLVWLLAVGSWNRQQRPAMFHVVIGSVLFVLFLGRHSIRGYYAYPAALACLSMGGLASAVTRRLRDWLTSTLPGLATLVAIPVAIMLAIALVPGSGLRTLQAHLRHWRDPAYDIRAFGRLLRSVTPGNGLVAVDAPFVQDFYLAERPVVEAIVDPLYYDVRTEPYDYVVLAPTGLKQVKPLLDDLELVAKLGQPGDEFALSAQVFRRIRAHGRGDSPGSVRSGEER